jgi:hypothetical protein
MTGLIMAKSIFVVFIGIFCGSLYAEIDYSDSVDFVSSAWGAAVLSVHQQMGIMDFMDGEDRKATLLPRILIKSPYFLVARIDSISRKRNSSKYSYIYDRDSYTYFTTIDTVLWLASRGVEIPDRFTTTNTVDTPIEQRHFVPGKVYLLQLCKSGSGFLRCGNARVTVSEFGVCSDEKNYYNIGMQYFYWDLTRKFNELNTLMKQQIQEEYKNILKEYP